MEVPAETEDPGLKPNEVIPILHRITVIQPYMTVYVSGSNKHIHELHSVTKALILQVVEQLDRFIVGQADAKRAVAIALRNRWRRHRLPEVRVRVRVRVRMYPLKCSQPC